jgi:hypothetical protein
MHVADPMHPSLITRRRFGRSLAAAGAALGLPPSVVAATNPSVSFAGEAAEHDPVPEGGQGHRFAASVGGTHRGQSLLVHQSLVDQ